MTITETIAHLQMIKDEHGDVNVCSWEAGNNEHYNIIIEDVYYDEDYNCAVIF